MRESAMYDRGSRQGMDDLVREYLPLVKRIALHWSARLPDSIDLDDLLQAGLMGLINAGESYDAARGASFATYASIRIKGAILDEVRRNDWTPRSLQQKMKQVSEAIKRVETRVGRVPTETEIAEELGIAPEEYRKTSAEISRCRMTALESLEGEQADTTEDPAGRLEDLGFRQSLLDALQLLPEKEQLMMSLYYSEELNLKEIGQVMGVSESRVSQIHGQALARLRTALADWSR